MRFEFLMASTVKLTACVFKDSDVSDTTAWGIRKRILVRK